MKLARDRPIIRRERREEEIEERRYLEELWSRGRRGEVRRRGVSEDIARLEVIVCSAETSFYLAAASCMISSPQLSSPPTFKLGFVSFAARPCHS